MGKSKNEEHSQGYVYIIPAELAESGSSTKALLYGLIFSLCNKHGTCWASNKYLAEKLGKKSITTISNYISQLQKEDWIDVALNEKRLRVISVTLAIKRMTPCDKTYDPLTEKRKKVIQLRNKEEYKETHTQKPEKLIYGEFQKVKLTAEEFLKLVDRMGEQNTKILIDELDAYIASKGKRYSSHYATILTWARRKTQEMRSVKPKMV